MPSRGGFAPLRLQTEFTPRKCYALRLHDTTDKSCVLAGCCVVCRREATRTAGPPQALAAMARPKASRRNPKGGKGGYGKAGDGRFSDHAKREGTQKQGPPRRPLSRARPSVAAERGRAAVARRPGPGA